MKKLIALVGLLLSLLPASAQLNQAFAVKEIWASDYGTWQVKSTAPNTYQWQPSSLCQFPVPEAIGNFNAFNQNAPVYILDDDVANSEVVTPSFVIMNSNLCEVALVTMHNHYSFNLHSGTAGLQEALNSIPSTVPYAVTVYLDRNWYTALGSIPGTSAATVISSVAGSAAANLIDQTQAPWAVYKWNGSNYAPANAATTKILNGVGQSCAYPQTTLTGRINTCLADAAALTNGNTSGKCSSTCEAITQSDTSGTTIAVGDNGGDQVVWEHPALCAWTFSGYSGGSKDIIDIYGGSAIVGASPVNPSCMIINHSSGVYSLLRTYQPTNNNSYFKVQGLGFENEGYFPASGAALVLNSVSDGSVFEDLLVHQYTEGDSAIWLNDLTAYGQCCTLTFHRVVADGNYTSGPILKITATNTNNQSGVMFDDVSLGHPAAGQPVITCTAANTVESFYFKDLYEEINHADTTTAVNQMNGCRAVTVVGNTLSNPGASENFTGPVWQFNGTYPQTFDLAGFTAEHFFQTPVIVAQDNSSADCASAPCNYMSDANGNWGHLTLGGNQADSIYSPLTTPASSIAACFPGRIAWDQGYIYICTAANTWKRVALSTF